MSSSSSNARRTTRFSLLLLQHSEVLLSDIAVNYHFIPDASVGSTSHALDSFPKRFVRRRSTNVSVRGRVKLATHSIFFDCDDWRDPILRIPLESIETVRPTRDTSRSHDSDNLGSKNTTSYERKQEDNNTICDNSVLVVANSVTFQRELGVDHPYIDMSVKGRHVFTPLYSSSDTFLDDIMLLLKIITIQSTRIRNSKLKQLVKKRESSIPFDITLLQYGSNEKTLMEIEASLIHTISKQPGRLRITKYNIYFMPIHGESTTTSSVNLIPIKRICGIRNLKHGCLDSVIEFTFTTYQRDKNKSLMLSLPSKSIRTKVLNILYHQIESFDNIQMFSKHELELTLNRWRNGAMSNFDYLMYLNFAAGRSFNDLSQYPVFPWVIQDYTSSKLDLNNPSTFRNLYKPIGALNEKRFENFRQRYEELSGTPYNQTSSSTNDNTNSVKKTSSSSSSAFFYGTHYSTPAYIINYLVRAAPAAMLRLQNGKFDSPDRLFHNVSTTWESVLNNPGDVKELIPEFYTLNYEQGNASGVLSSTSTPGQFLDNVLGLELGIRQDGIRVDDIELPPWANGSSHLFVTLMRQALESDYVSSHLHGWIDLIFGIKSRNPDFANVFFTDVALPRSIDHISTNIQDDEELDRIETVYLEFGRTPDQIFQHPHPPRFGDLNLNLSYQQQQNLLQTTNSNTSDFSASHDAANITTPQNRADSANDEKDNSSDCSPERTADAKVSDTVKDGQIEETKSPPTRHHVCKKSRPRVHESYQNQKESPPGILARVEGGMTAKEEADKTPVTKIATCMLTPIVEGKNGSVEKDSFSSLSSKNGARILDMCLISDRSQSSASIDTLVNSDNDNSDNDNSDNDNSDNSDDDNDVDHQIDVCTIWDNDYLKVHSANKKKTLLRSKYINGINCVTHIGEGIIAYGTRNGSIGLYHIGSARNQIVAENVHEGDIQALIVIVNQGILISSSLDGSVKLWTLDIRNTFGRLRFIVEVDAESCIEDICAILTTDTENETNNDARREPQNEQQQQQQQQMFEDGQFDCGRHGERKENKLFLSTSPTLSSRQRFKWNAGKAYECTPSAILLAVYTTDTTVLIWRLELHDPQPFPDPIWRHDHHDQTDPLSIHDVVNVAQHQLFSDDSKARQHRRRMTWIRQKKGNTPLLVCPPTAVTSDLQDHSLNVWDLKDQHMASAQVYLNDDHICGVDASQPTRTVVLAGTHGNLAEFDTTGLCIHRIQLVSTTTPENLHAPVPVEIIQLYVCPVRDIIVIWDALDNIYTLSLGKLSQNRK